MTEFSVPKSGIFGFVPAMVPTKIPVKLSPKNGSFEDQEFALGHSASPPSSGHKAVSRIAAPDCSRIDVCVMPLTRPAVISDCVSLSDKVGREVRAFVAKDSTVDALLPAGIDEFSPDEQGVAISCSENNLLSGPSEEHSLPAVPISVA
ncbi:hypothetical protein [Sinorhizobium chiapasense]|uniref:Uncharacterized protein n=1 Tax=Sinorhizobium chiapasense TaxID=501572 RepID=A0ABZ2BAX3_9HYPH